MTELDAWYEARRLMTDALAEDLLGSDADEELRERPLSRYLVGILYPRESAEEDAAATVDEDDPLGATDIEVPGEVADDPAVALSHVRYPSSLGLTFAADARSDRVTVEVDADRYVREADGDPSTPSVVPPAAPGGESPGEDAVGEEGTARVRGRRGAVEEDGRWVRRAYTSGARTLDLTAVGPTRTELTEGLDLHVMVRRVRDGAVAVTVSLVNTNTAGNGEGRDEAAWFRPRIVVRGDLPFVDRPLPRAFGVDDEDLESYGLLYRDVANLAVGHGCAVVWDDDPAGVHRLTTTFLPTHDLRLAEPSGGGTGERAADLDMASLARVGAVDELRALVTDYRAWIEDRAGEVSGLEEGHRVVALRHLDSAREAARRIEQGIDLLVSDETAARAFALMNAAMKDQRDRQEMLRARQNGGTYEPSPQRWRPFQMAFILLNLVGLTVEESDERDIADLLWFPTGGGKTEAYLGAIGYVVLLRRLRNSAHGGVSVIMRYTLRLLTTQQFERAAGLICALELIRRRELPDAEPISLGLWVGQGATPNKVEDARKALRRIATGDEAEEGNPMQLLQCPWCGAPLGHEQYVVPRTADRLVVRCADPGCEFGRQLSVHLTDEDVYRERPSLVIGTVDKFAMMAWREQAGNLFSTDGRHPAPDLIVQDELHLISGPLGTLVGLYETAVDAASTRPARPKLIASTATIRRARSQVHAVFDRDSRQFPPPGLDRTDSYFARSATPEEKGTRQYLGVLAPGVSHATLFVRSYAALLQRARTMEVSDQVRDAYWTLLGYFNSLRVLGGSYMQVIDDVPDRINLLATRSGAPHREISEPHELTSRRSSSEIPRELATLGKRWTENGAADVVLATNMISVGVDVDRLGLMVVMGQPQTTAEYIQATSRVGRRYPGLVVMLYNGARSRDLSHYENFTTYHRSLDRQVEATGATPFAARARDRGVHGVLVAMARMLIPGLRGSKQAGAAATFEEALREQAAALVARASSVAPEEVAGLEDQLERLVESWTAESGHLDKYEGWYQPDGALLVPAGTALREGAREFPVEDPPWPTLMSLRNVDVETSLREIRPRRRNRRNDA